MFFPHFVGEVRRGSSRVREKIPAGLRRINPARRKKNSLLPFPPQSGGKEKEKGRTREGSPLLHSQILPAADGAQDDALRHFISSIFFSATKPLTSMR
jgi:hypothetical protein